MVEWKVAKMDALKVDKRVVSKAGVSVALKVAELVVSMAALMVA